MGAPTTFTDVKIIEEINPQGVAIASTGNIEIVSGNLTIDAGNIVVTGNISATGTVAATGGQANPSTQGGAIGAAGVRETFVKAQPGLVLPTGALVVTLFTITLPNVAAGGGFDAVFTAVDKTSAGSSTRTARITGSYQRVAGAVASGAVSALQDNTQADNGGGHGLTFGALAATQAGGATVTNTLAITCSVTGATNTDTFDLMTYVELLNLEVGGASLS